MGQELYSETNEHKEVHNVGSAVNSHHFSPTSLAEAASLESGDIQELAEPSFFFFFMSSGAMNIS